MTRAVASWGKNLPDWIQALAARCDAASQSTVADELDVSSSAVNQVLGASYKGRLERFELRVRGKFMRATVQCPVLGQIPTSDCVSHQERARVFTATNPLRRALFTACKSCPNREDACPKPKSS
jgi:hypothetical protein